VSDFDLIGLFLSSAFFCAKNQSFWKTRNVFLTEQQLFLEKKSDITIKKEEYKVIFSFFLSILSEKLEAKKKSEQIKLFFFYFFFANFYCSRIVDKFI